MALDSLLANELDPIVSYSVLLWLVLFTMRSVFSKLKTRNGQAQCSAGNRKLAWVGVKGLGPKGS